MGYDLEDIHPVWYFNPTIKVWVLRVMNKQIINFQHFIQNTNVQDIKQPKYLEVTVSNELFWLDYIKVISNKANFVASRVFTLPF